MHRQGLEAVEAIIKRPRASYRTITVEPLTPVLGAEVGGVDLGNLNDETFAEIRRAFVEHHVLVFRDQTISDEDHKAFGRRFGKLHSHPLHAVKKVADPEVLEVKADNNSTYVAGEGWHTDVTCDLEPPMGSQLYIRQTPEIGCGGDTMFANMHLAYEMLSAPVKAMLEGLTAVHDGALPYVQAYGFKPEVPFPRNEHPVVIRHPDTGRKILFVNSGFTSHIVQLARFESHALLSMIYRMIEQTPALQARVRWQPNTLVMWDNRCTQHHAVWDYYPLARSGKRVSIIGDQPSQFYQAEAAE